MSTRKVLTVLAALALAACGDTATKIPTGSVSGTATYSTGSDHSGISITVAGFSTTTNAAGAWSLGDVPAGAQVVIAVAPDSVERTQTVAVNVSGATTATAITFTRSQALAGMVSAVGASSAGITVTLDGNRTTTTDAQGAYSFTGVPAGTHTLGFAAPGGYTDQISGILFSPDIGAFVPDPQRDNAVYRMGPFEMQNGNRLLSSNKMATYTQLSPDGSLYAWVVPVTGTSYGTLSVAPVATGSAVTAASNVYATSWRFSPDSKSIVFNSDDGALYAVSLTTGPLAAGAPTKLGDNVGIGTGAWDFSTSPTAGTTSSVYFVADNAVAGTIVRTLFEKVVATGAQLNQFNVADPINYFRVTKAGSVVFWTTGATNRLQSAPCTGASVATFATLDAAVTSLGVMAFSSDESIISWINYGGGVAGLKVGPVNGATGAVLLDASTSIGQVRISPVNDRIAWYGYYSYPYPMWVRPTDGSVGAVSLGSNGWGEPGIRFSADGQTMARVIGSYPNFNLVVGPASGGAGATLADTGYLYDYCGNECDFVVGLAPDGSAVTYAKRDVNTGIPSTYVRVLTAPAATLIASNTRRSEFTADSAAVLYELSTTTGVNLYMRPTATGTATLIGARSNTVFGGAGMVKYNPGKTHFLAQTDLDQAVGLFDTKVVSLATGAVTPLVRKTPVAEWTKVGTSDRVLTVRRSSAPPYGFQDGIYLSTVP